MGSPFLQDHRDEKTMEPKDGEWIHNETKKRLGLNQFSSQKGIEL
jgi:hypothetical protein